MGMRRRTTNTHSIGIASHFRPICIWECSHWRAKLLCATISSEITSGKSLSFHLWYIDMLILHKMKEMKFQLLSIKILSTIATMKITERERKDEICVNHFHFDAADGPDFMIHFQVLNLNEDESQQYRNWYAHRGAESSIYSFIDSISTKSTANCF